MFSKEYYEEIKKGFEEQLALLEERKRRLSEESADGIGALRLRLLREKEDEIQNALAECEEDEAEALVFLYSAMPLSDLLDYPAALFLTYARHGAFLWKEGPFAGKVPERIFANYVLHYRVNNEDIVDTRGFFYDRLIDRVAGKGMEEAVLEANYWCAREATYRASDGRTQNARTLFGTATGRCGEESTFGTTVLRSIGIPARQVYAPLWTHCDDNHAWVEAWCDGTWRFLGACEPEERLNYGWFIGPASRAMLLHSRWFSKEAPQEEVVGNKGMCRMLNHLDRYAYTTTLTVKVVDEAGRPVPGARVNFQVLNHGELGSIAVMTAGKGSRDCGIVKMTTGFGNLYLSASADGAYGEASVSLLHLKEGEEAFCAITLKDRPECGEGWKDLNFHAPVLGFLNDDSLTPEQKAVGLARNQAAAQYRDRKKQGFYDAREASRVLGRFGKEDRAILDDILHKAYSNMTELVRFLEWDASGWVPENWEDAKEEHWKVEVLRSLREKDWWDIKADILKECCVYAFPYAGGVPREVYYRFLVNPRADNEMVRLCRAILDKSLSAVEKEEIRRAPDALPAMVDSWIVSMPEREYESLITSPVGSLRGGIASAHSKEIFCVTVYRTLGIPARLSMLDRSVEYFRNGAFHSVKPVEETGTLILGTDGSFKLTDWDHYSLERFEDGEFCFIGLWEKLFRMTGSELELQLAPGIYRVLTTNRQISGDQLAKICTFSLRAGERRKMELALREIPVEAMLTRNTVEDMTLRTAEGEETAFSELAKGGKSLFLWLEVTREPTEHILNELYEKNEDFARLSAPLYVVLRSPEDLEDKTLQRTMGSLPMIHPVFHDLGEDYQKLSMSVKQEVGKLPLALVMKEGLECVYSSAGYNVGLADILWRILNI